MALHTGEVQLRDEGNYIGTAINRCARIRALAHGGQTLLSRTTHDLVVERLPVGASLVDLGPQRLRDLARPEHVFELAHAELPTGFPPLRSLDALPNNLPAQLTSFIGREAELADVELLLPDARLLTLVGSGGCRQDPLGVAGRSGSRCLRGRRVVRRSGADRQSRSARPVGSRRRGRVRRRGT